VLLGSAFSCEFLNGESSELVVWDNIDAFGSLAVAGALPYQLALQRLYLAGVLLGDASTGLAAAGCEEQARARRRAFVEACPFCSRLFVVLVSDA
jgi:hypothetical protein